MASIHVHRLTGLPNRGRFVDLAERALCADASNGRLVALCIFDLDYFKEINDSLGHPISSCMKRRAALPAPSAGAT
jgi:diguanylate cyclase (GGDEF)-like protein